MGGPKNAKDYNERKGFLQYIKRPILKKKGNPKNERAEKT